MLLCLSPVPILMMPPSSFSPASQEWWLPVLLCCFAAIALVQVLIRRSAAAWPLRLISFCQGMSVISRLMMLVPHATVSSAAGNRFDGPYVALTMLSIFCSLFFITYCEIPEVQRSLQA